MKKRFYGFTRKGVKETCKLANPKHCKRHTKHVPLQSNNPTHTAKPEATVSKTTQYELMSIQLKKAEMKDIPDAFLLHDGKNQTTLHVRRNKKNYQRKIIHKTQTHDEALAFAKTLYESTVEPHKKGFIVVGWRAMGWAETKALKALLHRENVDMRNKEYHRLLVEYMEKKGIKKNNEHR